MQGVQLVAAADLSDDQRTVQEWAHEFAEEVIRPTAAANDQERRQPLDVLKAAAEVGLLTLAIPDEFGGGGVASDSGGRNAGAWATRPISGGAAAACWAKAEEQASPTVARAVATTSARTADWNDDRIS